MSEFKSSNFRNEDGSGGPDIVGLTTFTSPYYFVPPSGTTAQRPSDPAPGMLRFNEDIGRLEVWRNDHWATILGESPNLGNQLVTNSAGGTGARGLFMGGLFPGSTVSTVDYVTISTLGDGQDFGDLSAGRRIGAGFASATRAVAAGGLEDPANVSTIEYFTISSTGNATSFGTLASVKRSNGGLANSTRGISFGGTPVSQIEYVTIATTGTRGEFGNLSNAPLSAQTYGSASSTRGLMSGGETPGQVSNIDYITISTTGNAQNFGNLSGTRSGHCAVSNSTRILFAGGESGPAFINTIEFVTTATLGNTQDFGDLSNTRRQSGTASSPTRGLIAGGGNDTPAQNTAYNIIDYVTLSTTGNGIDFGDLQAGQARWQIMNGTVSNAHGGL